MKLIRQGCKSLKPKAVEKVKIIDGHGCDSYTNYNQ